MQHSRQKIVDKMMSWLGCHEGDPVHKHIIDTYNAHQPLARGYKVKYTDAWCATTVSAAAIECGYTDIIPTECSCNKMIDLLKKMGIWQEDDGYVPGLADIILYDWDDNGIGDDTGPSEHVGFVASEVVNNHFRVIEGNKSDGVNLRTMTVNGKYIRGYGTPKYDDVKVSPPTVVRPPEKYQFGIDVSKYQGVIDYDKAKAAGVSFVVIRSTSKNGNVDQYFERNYSECVKHRIDYSCYKLSYALTRDQARAEANLVINLIRNRKMMIWLDLEDKSQLVLGTAGIESIALAFIEECNKAGFQCGIYCDYNWYQNHISDYLKNNFLFWIARTEKNDTGSFNESHKPIAKGKPLFGWQYSHKGKVPGIEGNVDLDILF